MCSLKRYHSLVSFFATIMPGTKKTTGKKGSKKQTVARAVPSEDGGDFPTSPSSNEGPPSLLLPNDSSDDGSAPAPAPKPKG